MATMLEAVEAGRNQELVAEMEKFFALQIRELEAYIVSVYNPEGLRIRVEYLQGITLSSFVVNIRCLDLPDGVPDLDILDVPITRDHSSGKITLVESFRKRENAALDSPLPARGRLNPAPVDAPLGQ